MIVETWKPIRDFPGYEVSDTGKVRSWKKKGPAGYLRDEPVTLNPELDRDGYQKVTLWISGRPYKRMIHRLVAETFIGVRPVGYHVCHSDGNSLNNRVANLRYDTRSANERDKVSHGTSSRGSGNANAKITESQAREIKALLIQGDLQGKEIAVRYGISPKTVSHIKSGKAWTHI